MLIRDKLNSFDKYMSLIKFNKETIIEWEDKIRLLKDDDVKGICRYNRSNIEVIKYTQKSIFIYQQEIMLATYSSGLPIEKFTEEFIRAVEYAKHGWESRGGYLSMLNMLSIAIILNLQKEQLILSQLIMDASMEFKINDFLINYLMSFIHKSNYLDGDFLISKPYSLLKNVISTSMINKNESVLLLLQYLQKKWLNALKRQDLIMEVNSSTEGGYYGCWSFESAALVKILDLNDAPLKGKQYYPYDLIHYKSL